MKNQTKYINKLLSCFLLSVLILSCSSCSLNDAIKNSDFARVQSLLSDDSLVNKKDKYGDTPLQLAVEKENIEIIKLLLNKGADVNSKNNNGEDSLKKAISIGNLEIAELLIERGATVKGAKRLHQAAYSGKFDMARLFIDNGANVNELNESGDTPLFKAIGSYNNQDRLKIINLLLENGANQNLQKNKYGSTCLMLAISKAKHNSTDDMAIIDVLLANRPNLNIQSKNGDSALVKAIDQELFGLIPKLLNSKVKPTSQILNRSLMKSVRLYFDSNNRVMIIINRFKVEKERETRFLEIISNLLNLGANPNALQFKSFIAPSVTQNGRYVTMTSIKFGDIVETNSDGVTLLNIAVIMDDLQLEQLLVNNDATY